MPELSVTVEHGSTRAGWDFVNAHRKTAATLTPHHLSRERSHLLPDVATTMTTGEGEDVVLFGADEATRWSVSAL